MADIERIVRDLRVRLEESPNDRRLTMTIEFNVRVGPGPDGVDNYTIIVPRMIDGRLDRLIGEFKKIISDEDQVVRDLVVDKDVLIDLQQIT